MATQNSAWNGYLWNPRIIPVKFGEITPSGLGGYGPQHEKTCLRGFGNNTGADQPAHPRSLISAIAFRFLESIICELATDEMSIFYLVSVAEETCLKLALSETPKTGSLASRPICGLKQIVDRWWTYGWRTSYDRNSSPGTNGLGELKITRHKKILGAKS